MFQALTQKIDAAFNSGKTFRLTRHYPRRVSVLDYLEAALDIDYFTAKKCLEALIAVDNTVSAVVTYYNFDGSDTPVTGAEGLLLIVSKLRGYPMADLVWQDMIAAFDRYHLGDTTLKQEVLAMREAQQNMPREHPHIIFGEAVESGQVGNYHQRMDPVNLVQWLMERDAKDRKERAEERAERAEDRKERAKFMELCAQHMQMMARF